MGALSDGTGKKERGFPLQSEEISPIPPKSSQGKAKNRLIPHKFVPPQKFPKKFPKFPLTRSPKGPLTVAQCNTQPSRKPPPQHQPPPRTPKDASPHGKSAFGKTNPWPISWRPQAPNPKKHRRAPPCGRAAEARTASPARPGLGKTWNKPKQDIATGPCSLSKPPYSKAGQARKSPNF